MRFTIVLALCFIGAASASSLNKRSLVNDIQNNTRNAFHAFEQFGQNINEKVQEAFKNLFNAFVNNKNQTTEAPVTVTKRSSNPFALFDDLGKGDLVAFAQDLLKVLADVAPGRRKRDAVEDLRNLLSDFVNQHQATEASVIVTKRDSNPFALIDDLAQGNLFAFAHDLLKVLAEVAPGRRKRDAVEDLKKLSDEAKQNSEESLKKIFAFFEQFKPQSSESSDSVIKAESNAEEAIDKLFSLIEQTNSEPNELSKAFTMAKFSVDGALWKFITLFEQCKPQSNELSTAFTVAKYSAEDAVWKLISLFGQLQDAVAKTSSSSRGKRALSPFALTEDIQSGDVGKFFADLKQAHLESASYGIGMAERQ
ncbi:uncharacterized protein LOC107369317 isoform X2 [Tetranychus urticae]|uniref:uncharacterized protein LOC107369317 isoform X2 n=1 Tax=Tetranychus urticae TaxID=32264 RepID=UPI000D65C145|nr:uncharacterized protein LOC107369317 isoform X2 [Tetranychus urticae]